MKARTLEEWIAYYEKKTGGKHTFRTDEKVAFHPEHGYLSFIDPAFSKPGVFEGHIIVGDAPFWIDCVKKYMRGLGLTKARFYTTRNPEAVMKRYGGKIKGYWMEIDIDDFKI
jgi:hypothetical protein